MDKRTTAKPPFGSQGSRNAAALQLVNSSDKKLQCVAFGHALSLALSGDALAMYTVSHCLEKGKGVEPNAPSAMFWLIRSAMVDDAPAIALYRLAARHLEGSLDHSDDEFGLKLMGRSAKLGHVAARKRLLIECESVKCGISARKVTFDVLSELAGAVSPNRYHVEAFMAFTRHYPASAIWDA